MFSLSVNGIDHKIATDWHELPWSNYIKALNAQRLASPDEYANINVLSALTGISQRLIRNMLTEQRNLLISLCEFYWSDEIPMQPIDEKIKGIDIGLESWHKMNRSSMEFDAVAKAELHELAAAQAVCKMYTEKRSGKMLITPGKDLNKMSVSEALPYAAFFLISSKSGQKRTPICMLMNRATTKLQQGSKSSKYSNGSGPLTDLRKAIQRSMRQYLSNLPLTYIKRCSMSTHRRTIMNNSESMRSSQRINNQLLTINI